MATEVPVEEVPEVLEFLDSKTDLEAFCAQNSKVMQEYAALCEQYNASLEAADKKIRQMKVDCGPFKQLSPQVKIHAEKLYGAVGRVEFIKAGGIIGSVPTYSIDKKTFEAAVERGAVPQELVPVVKEIVVKYSNIPKAVIP